MEMKALHPIPKISKLWGYDHCPLVFNTECPSFASALSRPSVANGLLMLVSGAKKQANDTVLFSRPPDSWISLDEISIGIAHWWSNTAPGILESIAKNLPSLASHAWGEDVSKKMSDKWLRDQINIRRGKYPYNKKYDWLLSGWWEIGLHPDVVNLQAKEWLSSYPPHAVSVMKSRKLKKTTTFAALTRISNSVGGGGMTSMVSKAIIKEFGGKLPSEDKLLDVLFSDNYYGHADRLENIREMKSHFNGEVDIDSILDDILVDLDYDQKLIKRIDGTRPSWL